VAFAGPQLLVWTGRWTVLSASRSASRSCASHASQQALRCRAGADADGRVTGRDAEGTWIRASSNMLQPFRGDGPI